MKMLPILLLIFVLLDSTLTPSWISIQVMVFQSLGCLLFACQDCMLASGETIRYRRCPENSVSCPITCGKMIDASEICTV
ncbi:hypothetical protein L210DRAFT_3590151, partial [Boletus edulis BED1]